MPGGLLMLIVDKDSGSFLTNNPELTFFKMIYRKYNNFGKEISNIKTSITLGEEIELTIPKHGDLINKILLEIQLPEISFTRQQNQKYYTELNALHNNIKKFKYQYDLINDFTNISINAIKSNDYLIPNNIDIVLSIIDEHNFKSDECNIFVSHECTNNNKIIDNLIKINKYLFQKYNELLNEKKYFNIAKFAWLQNVEYKIIDHIEVKIGQETIDIHYGEWLYISNQLTNNYTNNISTDLFKYNRIPKNKCNLYIPLQFWFCKHNTSAFPYVACKDEIKIKIKLNDLSKCSKYEYTDFPVIIATNVLHIENIFLDANERKKFVQSTHEYFMETSEMEIIDMNQFTNDNDEIININTRGAIKEIYWTCENEPYTYLQLDSCQIFYNEHPRTELYEATYFSLLTHFYNKKNMINNIYNYTFSVYSYSQQPSGFLGVDNNNLSLAIKFKFNKNNSICKIYIVKYSILKISNGKHQLF